MNNARILVVVSVALLAPSVFRSPPGRRSSFLSSRSYEKRQTTERKRVKLPNKSASNCRTALARLTGMIDTARMKEVAFRMVLTATGDYAYTRPDGVHVCPIGCLKP